MKISKRNKMAAHSFCGKVMNGFLDIGKTMGSVCRKSYYVSSKHTHSYTHIQRERANSNILKCLSEIQVLWKSLSFCVWYVPHKINVNISQTLGYVCMLPWNTVGMGWLTRNTVGTRWLIPLWGSSQDGEVRQETHKVLLRAEKGIIYQEYKHSDPTGITRDAVYVSSPSSFLLVTTNRKLLTSGNFTERLSHLGIVKTGPFLDEPVLKS